MKKETIEVPLRLFETLIVNSELWSSGHRVTITKNLVEDEIRQAKALLPKRMTNEELIENFEAIHLDFQSATQLQPIWDEIKLRLKAKDE